MLFLYVYVMQINNSVYVLLETIEVSTIFVIWGWNFCQPTVKF